MLSIHLTLGPALCYAERSAGREEGIGAPDLLPRAGRSSPIKRRI